MVAACHILLRRTECRPPDVSSPQLALGFTSFVTSNRERFLFLMIIVAPVLRETKCEDIL